MNKLILYSILFLQFAFVKAQNYFPFPDSNAVWNVHYSSVGGCPGCMDWADYSYIMESDTAIGNYSYKKISISRSSGIAECTDWTCSPNCCPQAGTSYYYYGYYGALREDSTKKIYFISTGDTSESLLYDFNLNVGDTILSESICGNAIIDSIDSMLIGSQYRKKWNVAGISLIEGIGSTSGLFECIYCFEVCNELVCFKSNNKVLYTLYYDTICGIVINNISIQNTVNRKTHITISPNPLSSTGKIKFENSSNEEFKLILFNSLGNKIEEMKTHNNEFIITAADKNSSIYFYLISNQKGSLYRGKIVILKN